MPCRQYGLWVVNTSAGGGTSPGAAYEYLAMKASPETGEEVGRISRSFIYFVGRKFDLQLEGKEDMKVKNRGVSVAGA